MSLPNVQNINDFVDATKNQTLLMLSVKNNNYFLTDLLLKMNADTTIKDSLGLTVNEYIKLNNDVEMDKIFSNNQIEKQRISLINYREKPSKSIKRALKLYKKNNGKIIVELGSIRQPLKHPLGLGECFDCWDGHSTFFWAKTKTKVYAVDIDINNTLLTQASLKNYQNVIPINQDGIEFLKNFEQPIDLLFLDAWDAIPGTNYAEKHLEAYQAAKKNLHQNSLILIDDTDVDDGGKGKLIVPEATKDGYKLIFNGRQTLLAR